MTDSPELPALVLVNASGVDREDEPEMALSVLDDFARKDGWGGVLMRFDRNDVPLIVRAMVAYGDERAAVAALSSAPVAGELDPATVEACAKVAADFYRGHGKTFRTPRAYAYEHAGKAIAGAIRRKLAAPTPKDTGERGSGEARS